MIISILPDLTSSYLAFRLVALVLSASKRAILASGKRLDSSDSKSLVPKPLWMMFRPLHSGQE